MTEKIFSKTYERPQAEVIDILPEGVMCGNDSGLNGSSGGESGNNTTINW